MKQQSVKKNFILNTIRVLLSIVFPLITYPYASRTLGTVGVGRESYVYSIINYFTIIAGFGVSSYAISEGAKLRDDRKSLNRFASEMLLISIITTFIAYVLFFAVLFIPKFDDYRELLVLSSTTILLTTMGVDWLYQILEQYTYITVVTIAFQLAALIMMFVLVRDEGDVMWYVLDVAVSTTGFGIVNFVHSRRFVTFFKGQSNYQLKRHIRPMLYLFGVTLAAVIYTNSDISMLGWMKGDVDAGIYSTASKLVQTAATVIRSLSIVVLPRISYYMKDGDTDRAKGLINQTLKFIIMIVVPSVVGIILIAPEIIHFISGNNYDEFLPAVRTLKILALYLFLSPINGFIAYQIFLPRGRQRTTFYATISGAVMNIILNAVLIPKFTYDGAAVATLISEATVMAVCCVSGRSLIPFRECLGSIWRYLLATVPMMVICIGLRQLEWSGYLSFMLVMVVLAVISYFVMLLLLGDDIIKHEVSNIIGKLPGRRS